MTAVAGLEHAGKVWIGADSAVTNTDNLDLDIKREPKVFVVGEFIFGFCGSGRLGQLLQYSITFPKQKRRQSDMSFLVNDFTNAARAVYKGAGHIATDGSEQESVYGDFLLGYKGKLYIAQSDFCICRSIAGYYATGSGSPYVLGSLFSTRYDGNPKKRIETALKAAERFNAAVRAPFTIVAV